MPLGLYKPGQGNWSRGVAAGGLAAFGLWGALETRAWMIDYTVREKFYVGNIVPGIILLAFLWAAWFVANRMGTTDFIIETETEMKKVTWPTTREIVGATVVVVIVVVVLGAFMFGVDQLLEKVFKLVHIF
jgi:preprotein translocase SecE subunit